MSVPAWLPRLLTTLLASAGLLAAAGPAGAAGLPADCSHERRTSAGAVDPSGLCVSLGYGIKPAGLPASAPAVRNVVARSQNGEALPYDYFVRSDIAQQIAAGTARPRGTYLVYYGGAFICGNRADVAWNAREMARRGYVVIAAEYPLVGTLSGYGNYKPYPGHDQGQLAVAGSNNCNAFDSWTQTSAWKNGYLPRLRAIGMERVLTEVQRTGQLLVRHLRANAASFGIDAKRIFAFGWSAGGSVALRLALGGDDDAVLYGGKDPGDSSIAGALSISGPACFPGSLKITALMLNGQIRPSESPTCRFQATAADPPVLMLQEPRGGADDVFVPSQLMADGCAAINQYVRGRCIYEDRPVGQGGFVASGQHAAVSGAEFNRLLNVLAQQGVGQP